ncbi:hypothetical protein CYMTET_27529, partial [Cymbomonas tetramitiformis]
MFLGGQLEVVVEVGIAVEGGEGGGGKGGGGGRWRWGRRWRWERVAVGMAVEEVERVAVGVGGGGVNVSIMNQQVVWAMGAGDGRGPIGGLVMVEEVMVAGVMVVVGTVAVGTVAVVMEEAVDSAREMEAVAVELAEPADAEGWEEKEAMHPSQMVEVVLE